MPANSSQWSGDSIYKLCPQIFTPIYTIHALVNNENLSCVFALLPSKIEIVYEQFFTTVCNDVTKGFIPMQRYNGMQQYNNGIDTDGFLVYFDTAAINAI